MDYPNPDAVAPPAEPGPAPAKQPVPLLSKKSPEFGGPEGPEPTRYGDWERNGRCVDF